MRIFSFLIFIIILCLGVSFAVLNAKPVMINYYLGTNELPLSLLLVLVLGVGAIIGWLTGLFIWIRLKGENMRLCHRLKVVEREVDQLRTLPVNNNT